MPYALTHFLIPALLVALFRDFFANKKKFSLHYVFIAGLAGLLPDFDIAISYIISSNIHRTFSHTLFIPLIFLIIGFIFMASIKEKGKIKLSTLLFVIGFGFFIHLLLDYIIIGSIMPIYPLSNIPAGLNLVNIFPMELQNSAEGILDAAILIFWMIYIELKHKISDFI